MPENDRLSGSLDQIDLEFVEREATPRLLMKLSIQLHLAGLSLSNTVSFLDVFGVDRARSTVHNWVHKADLQPETGRSPDHVAVDETVISNRRERTHSQRSSSANSVRNTMSTTPCFSSMNLTHCKTRVDATASISDTRNMEIGMLSNVSSEKQNDEPPVSQTVSATLTQKLPTIGSDRSASHGISLSKHLWKRCYLQIGRASCRERV